MFPHEDNEFAELIRIVADARSVSPGLVEKDYWVTHTLWALEESGLEIWFKGGTSLSKGFAVIERFSEDLDLKIERGTLETLPQVDDWVRTSTRAKRVRQEFFEKFADAVSVPGAQIVRETTDEDDDWFAASYQVSYPGNYLAALGSLKPYVLLEFGSSRVVPFVERDIRSLLHEWLEENSRLDEFGANVARNVRCLHPYVTLIEKLEAIHRRIGVRPPATYVRHFEDVAAIIRRYSTLPPLDGYSSAQELAKDMFAKRDIRWMPESSDAAFDITSDAPWLEITQAYDAISGMYWTPTSRLSLDGAVSTIHDWVKTELDRR